MRKFADVDIISALRKIVNNNNLHYKSDFEYDADTLKIAEAGERFLWLSRYSGTWLMNERDAHIRNTEAHSTWQYYSDTKYYGVKAFAVEIKGNEGGKPVGDIYELNYNKHREAVRVSSFNANTVDVTFKPTRSEDSATRTFDIAEYSGNWRAILNRYGAAESVRHKLSNEDEALLAEILGNFKMGYENESEPASVNDYVRDMVRERFHEYGYTRDDMAFTTPEDAFGALKHKIPVYILHPGNGAEQVHETKDIGEALYERRIFGMGARDKQLLNFFVAGNTLADLPFSHRELSTIFHMALDRGKENIEDEQQRKAIDGIIKVLDTMLFADDGRDAAELELDQEFDEGIEQ
jgi:hypothetical protein